ncbi:hypothetical protein [Natranaerobius trueperi]|nr:hypothetical protein [Natranaerobius trueperi]
MIRTSDADIAVLGVLYSLGVVQVDVNLDVGFDLCKCRYSMI